MDPNEEYTQFGYLEELDEFDYKFFNLSKSEAICMDPQSRITLELACGAIESAGYSLSSLRGTNTAVIIGTGKSSYDQLFKDKPHIIQKTDNDLLFQFSLEEYKKYGYHINKISYDLHSENIPNIMTEYEEKFSNMGIKIKYVDVSK